jgi:transcriptional regulator with XRE-family HTH domain
MASPAALEFARKITLLRKEKGITQKEAAKSLNISQTNLSHYEVGSREPNMTFVCQVADFYAVSVDFLFGRSVTRDIGVNLPEQVIAYANNDSLIPTSATKQIIDDSLEVLFNLMSSTNDGYFIKNASSLIFLSLYRVFRFVAKYNPNNPKELFAVKETFFTRLAAARENITENWILDGIAAVGYPDLPILTTSYLEKQFGKQALSLMTLVLATEKSLTNLGE